MTRCYGCMREYDENEKACPHCGYDNKTKPKEAYHILPGTIISGRYLIGKCVGQGGFGITYIGWDLQLERKVAVKEYFPSDFATRAFGQEKLTVYNGEPAEQFESGLKSFIDEAQRLAKFNGIKGVVDIYDTFIENNTGYIVMEFLSGISVKDMLKANGTLDYATAKEIVVEMLYILREVHKDGIIHRDIAPDNIFITDTGEFKLLDFGAARYATTTHSKSLSVILKPGYAPEEQYRSHGNQGPWTDIYALAATFYKLITGVTPPESMERRAKDTLVPPSKAGFQIPKNDEIALLNALNILPENRIQSAQEFLDALGGKKVVRKKERNLIKDTGKINKSIFIFLALAVFIVVAFVVLVKTRVIDLKSWVEMANEMKLPDGYALVKNVVGETEADAKQDLEARGFKVESGGIVYSDTIEEGKITYQTPSNGTEAKEATILIVTSAGPKMGDLGEFMGRMAEEVKAEWESRTFYNVNIEKGTENTSPQGVIERVVINGEEAAANLEKAPISSNIKLYASTGENYDPTAVLMNSDADYSGKKYEDISAEATALGFIIGDITRENSDTIAEGIIISQNIRKDGDIVYIDFVISDGVDKGIDVPNVVNYGQEDAVYLLEQMGLNVNIERKSDSKIKSGYVISQSPSKGTNVSKGASVTIVVSSGSSNAGSQKQTQVQTQRQTQKQTQAQTQKQTQVQTQAQTQRQTEPVTEATTKKPETTSQTTTKASTPFILDSLNLTVEEGLSGKVTANKNIRSAASADSSVAKATASGSEITVTGVATGKVIVKVVSVDGDSKNITVTVTKATPRPTLKLKENAKDGVYRVTEGSCGTVPISVSGTWNSKYEIKAECSDRGIDLDVSGTHCDFNTTTGSAGIGDKNVTISICDKETGEIVASQSVIIRVERNYND